MWTSLIVICFVGALTLLHLVWRRRYASLENQMARLRQDATEAHSECQRVMTRQQTSTQTLLNSMVEGIVLTDPAGRIQLVNPSLERMFGLKSDVRGLTLMEAFRSQDLSALMEKLDRSETVLGQELIVPGLERRCFEVNAVSLCGDAGRSDGAILVLHDLSRIKQLESTRQEFVANVSHELRTPLSLIKGCVETLIDGAQENPEVRDRFLRTIEKHADRLTYLIEDLLTLSQLEGGRIAMNLRAIQPREVASRVVEDLQARASLRTVTLENRMPADLFAHADGERLEQVLFNLVDNAIKYGTKGGRVLIDGRRRADGGVELLVQDDGPGIPPEAKERVFERFYRVDKARSREQGGTGLGLAIVKHIMQCHGGEVRIESEVGKGATFVCGLPPRRE